MNRRSRTPFAILSLLRVMPMSGYEIREFCRTRFHHFWNESFGQIYPTLTRLTEDGLIRPVDRADKPRATHYELTAAGRAALGAWLAEAPAPRMIRDEILLKLFCGSESPPGVLLEHLAAARRQAQERLAALDEATDDLDARAADHPDYPYWRLMARSGRLAFEARLNWCDEALTFIRARAQAERTRHD